MLGIIRATWKWISSKGTGYSNRPEIEPRVGDVVRLPDGTQTVLTELPAEPHRLDFVHRPHNLTE